MAKGLCAGAVRAPRLPLALLLCIPVEVSTWLEFRLLMLVVSLVNLGLSWALTWRGRCRAVAAAAAVGAPGDPVGVPAGTHVTVHLAAVPAAAAEAVVSRVTESQQVQRALPSSPAVANAGEAARQVPCRRLPNSAQSMQVCDWHTAVCRASLVAGNGAGVARRAWPRRWWRWACCSTRAGCPC